MRAAPQRPPYPGTVQTGIAARLQRGLLRTAGCCISGLLMQACTMVTASEPVYVPAPPPQEPVSVPAPRETVHVPPGHMPPPGHCRIWYPDRPPGHQPPPGDCRELRFRVPPGAVLIYGRGQ